MKIKAKLYQFISLVNRERNNHLFSTSRCFWSDDAFRDLEKNYSHCLPYHLFPVAVLRALIRDPSATKSFPYTCHSPAPQEVYCLVGYLLCFDWNYKKLYSCLRFSVLNLVRAGGVFEATTQTCLLWVPTYSRFRKSGFYVSFMVSMTRMNCAWLVSQDSLETTGCWAMGKHICCAWGDTDVSRPYLPPLLWGFTKGLSVYLLHPQIL